MRNANWKESWWIRKAIYAVLALALTIAVGGGWVSDTQADTWLAQADKIVSILAAVGLGIAATKTHRGSDDKATARDVAVAAGSTSHDPRLSDIGMIVNDIKDRLEALPVAAVRIPREDDPQPGIYPKG